MREPVKFLLSLMCYGINLHINYENFSNILNYKMDREIVITTIIVLFSNMLFWLSSHVPDRTTIIEVIAIY